MYTIYYSNFTILELQLVFYYFKRPKVYHHLIFYVKALSYGYIFVITIYKHYSSMEDIKNSALALEIVPSLITTYRGLFENRYWIE